MSGLAAMVRFGLASANFSAATLMEAHSHHHHPSAASLDHTALMATLHCLAGCAIGEVLGMVIGTARGRGRARSASG